MAGKILAIVFWIIFFGLFLLFAGDKPFRIMQHGWPDYMGDSWINKRLWFLIHGTIGTLVYLIAFLQFTPAIRNSNLNRHRILGKLYILFSVFMIMTLFIMIPGGMCKPCIPSQIMNTSLWLVFVLMAWYLVRLGKIEWHRRCMISSFICASYFVTIRVIDRLAMDFFRAISSSENQALLLSDLSVWLLPLSIVWIYWLIKPISKTPSLLPQ